MAVITLKVLGGPEVLLGGHFWDILELQNGNSRSLKAQFLNRFPPKKYPLNQDD